MPIRLSSGRLLFKATEELPPHVEGFIRDKTNPRLFLPIRPPCIHAIEIPCKTCGDQTIYKRKCRLKDEIKFLDCFRCQERKEP